MVLIASPVRLSSSFERCHLKLFAEAARLQVVVEFRVQCTGDPSSCVGYMICPCAASLRSLVPAKSFMWTCGRVGAHALLNSVFEFKRTSALEASTCFHQSMRRRRGETRRKK